MLSWLVWWALLLLVGVAAWPLAATVLPRFAAGGYAFAKPLGMLLLGYVYWIGVTAGVLPNSRLGAALALVAVAAASAVAVWRRRGIVAGLRRELAFVVGVEALFLIAFAVAAFLRSYVPEIASTEKPMEIGFLNAILRAGRFPAEDPWFAGEPISYYYFGFVLLAAITKLAGTAASVAFNLGLALSAALSVVAIFGLAYELVLRSLRAGEPRLRWRPWVFGLGAVGLALVLGNLEAVLELGAAHGWGSEGLYRWFDIADLNPVVTPGTPLWPKTTGHWYPDEFWWWWRATRVVPGTISEFPFFSFMLGDLHPHVMAIPFRFVMLAFSASVLLGDHEPAPRAWLRPAGLPALILIALLLGSMGPLSTWDLPTLAALLGGAALVSLARSGATPSAMLLGAAAFVAVPLALGSVAFLPFWTSIDNPGWGPRIVLGASTRPDHAVLLWGPLGTLVFAFVGTALARGDRAVLRDRRALAGVAAIVLVPTLIWATAALGSRGPGGFVDELAARGTGWVTDAALAAVLIATGLAVLQRALPGKGSDEPAERAATFALVAAFTGLLLIWGVEFFYIDDILHDRLNSVFKLYFQAWLLLAAAGGFGAWYLVRAAPAAAQADRARKGRYISPVLCAAVALVLAGGLVYPVTAALARTDGFAGPRTLDGFAWLRNTQPAEYRAQMWLREHSRPDEVVLEAYGEAYTDAGRVSTRTGTPTLLGWWIHEINWRGDKPAYAQRAAAMDRIYRTAEEAEARTLLKEYSVSFVYVGNLEMARYAGANLTKFAGFMDVAYDDGGVRIYRSREAGRQAAAEPWP